MPWLIWGNAAETVPAAGPTAGGGREAAFYGFDRLFGSDFVKLAGPAVAEGTNGRLPFRPGKTDPAWTNFVARFQKRYDMKPGHLCRLCLRRLANAH